MIKYVKRKKIDYAVFSELLEDTELSNQFTNEGPAKRKLEAHLHSYLGISKDKSLICCANGTVALHALLMYYNKNGVTKFCTPAFNFPSGNVGGFNLKVLDIDDTYSIPISEIDKYDGFVLTSLFGTYPKNIRDWESLCQEKRKILIFDNASSPLTLIDGLNICNFGNASFSSLHHTKFLGFGEGGFIVVDKELDYEFRTILGFGYNIKDKVRKFSKYSSNYKMSDISAASILQNIMLYDTKKHKNNQDYFLKEISKIDGAEPFNYTDGVFYGNMPIIFKKEIQKELFKGVECHKYYFPLKNYKNSMSLYKKIINFPLYDDISKYEMNIILNEIRIILKDK